MKFSAEQFLVLLNYLAQEASGLTTWRLDDSHTLKSYVFAGMPASNGVKAAALVRSGFTGRGDVLSPHGRNFFDALSSRMVPDALYCGLGTVHKILETDFKKHSVGFPIAAPVAALEEMIARSPISPAAVETLRVLYHHDWLQVVGDENRMPDLNLRYCLSVTLIDGALSFAAAHDDARMSAPDVMALASKIEFAPAEPDQDRFEARIELRAGGRVHRAAQGRHVLGRKENPMSAQQVHAKASELITTVLARDRAEQAIALVYALDEMPNIQPLLETLCVEF
jgi:2-methylcitrate dehydratase PrpD